MPALVVGGVTIKVAPGGIRRDRLDMVDRGRAFDGTYRASATGNPKGDYFFSTPPITRADADFYEMVLSAVASRVCSGDIIGGGSNQVFPSEDFADAAWTKITATVTPGISDPIGGTTAQRIAATGAGARIFQSLSAGSSVVRTMSFWMRRISGSGVINIAKPDNSVYVPVTLTSEWQRFSATGAASTVRQAEIGIATSGDAIDVWGAHLNDGAAPTQYVKTTTAVAATDAPACCPEITGWTPVRTSDGHRVVLDFALHEA